MLEAEKVVEVRDEMELEMIGGEGAVGFPRKLDAMEMVHVSGGERTPPSVQVVTQDF